MVPLAKKILNAGALCIMIMHCVLNVPDPGAVNNVNVNCHECSQFQEYFRTTIAC